jgi:hypothetical protein
MPLRPVRRQISAIERSGIYGTKIKCTIRIQNWVIEAKPVLLLRWKIWVGMDSEGAAPVRLNHEFLTSESG